MQILPWDLGFKKLDSHGTVRFCIRIISLRNNESYVSLFADSVLCPKPPKCVETSIVFQARN